jgi:prepilin signal peptidase PulO-like enzyme (type II secretory pathway)
MQSPTLSPLSLPYQLKRPYHAFFSAFTVVFLLTVVGAALSLDRSGLEMVLLMGGALWIGLGLGVVCNWQSMTL